MSLSTADVHHVSTGGEATEASDDSWNFRGKTMGKPLGKPLGIPWPWDIWIIHRKNIVNLPWNQWKYCPAIWKGLKYGAPEGCTWPVFGTSIMSETGPIQWVSMAIAMLGYCGNCNRMTFYFRRQNTTSARKTSPSFQMPASSEDPAANTFRIHNHSMRFWVISSFHQPLLWEPMKFSSAAGMEHLGIQVHHGQGLPLRSHRCCGGIRQQNIGYGPKPCGSYLSVCLSNHPSTHLSTFLSTYLDTCLSVYLSIHPSTYLIEL